MAEYSDRDLDRMKKDELRRLCEAHDIEVKHTWLRKHMIERIKAADRIAAAEQAQATPSQAGGVATPGVARSPSPEFERLAGDTNTAGEPVTPSGHGGRREGAGRPAGLTAEKARVKNLPDYPNIAIRQGVYVTFGLWSDSVKIPQVAIESDEEADLLALPMTQLAEYFFPGMIPEIAGVCVSFLYGCYAVVKPRLALIKEVQALRKTGKAEEVAALLKGGKKDAQ